MKKIIELGNITTAITATDIYVPIYNTDETGVKTRKITLQDIADLNSTDIATAQSTADAAALDATQALSDAADAVTDASNALSTANSAQSTATTANSNALTAIADSATALAAANNAIPLTQKGAANGVATLDGTGKVPASQLTVVSTSFKGNWNATTNTPTLSDGTGTGGDFYFVTNGASRDLGSGSVAWTTGALAIHDGSKWIENESANIITSVAGKTGAVTLVTNDVTASTDKRYVTDNQLAALAGNSGTPSATNTYVTEDGLSSALSSLPTGGSITVTGGGLDISVVEDGTNVSGNGSYRLLNTVTNPSTSVAYTNTSAAAKFPRTATAWGAIDVTQTTYDDVCLQEWLLLLQENVQSLTCYNRRFVVNLPFGYLIVPPSSNVNSNITSFKFNSLSIDGGHSSIRIESSGTGKTFFKRVPASYTLAMNGNQNYVNKRVLFTRWTLVGKSAANTTGVQLWASYNTCVTYCDFNNMTTGVDLRFAMNSTVAYNNFFNISNYGVYQDLFDTTTVPGTPSPFGGSSTSQITIEKNRFSINDGAIGAYCRGGDSTVIRDNIAEVPNGGVGLNAFVFDNAGSTNSKGVQITNTHLEGDYSDAAIRLRLQANCTAIIDNNYIQHTAGFDYSLVNLINQSGSNTVIIRDTGNHSGGGDWKLKYCYPGSVNGVAGDAGGFVFQNTMLQGNPQTPAAILLNSNVWKLTGTDSVPTTLYTVSNNQFTSPQTGSNRIKIDPRPL
jgi:hypothetical protein